MVDLRTNGRGLGWIAALLWLAGSPAAWTAPMPFIGGQIDDSRLDQGEIYIGAPKSAAAPPGCEVAENYATYVRTSQFDRIAALFTPDAVVFHDHGPPARGASEIAAFYGRRASQFGVTLVPVAYAVGPGMCLVQLAVSRSLNGAPPVYFSAAYDQFVMAPDGRARMMVSYGRRTPIVTGVMEDLKAHK